MALLAALPASRSWLAGATLDRSQYLRTMGITLWQRRIPAQTENPLVANLDPAGVCLAQASSSAGPDPARSTGPDATLSDQLSSGLNWTELKAAVGRCRACELHATRTQTVFGVGNQSADWMIVGEAPGADEDRLGEPFVGRAGKLLDLMLVACGRQRGDVYIANILKSRPPGNRDPAPAEMAACWPFLARQIELVEPALIIAMGRFAAQNLLNSTLSVARMRGTVHRFVGPGSPDAGIPLVVTYHPAYLLRFPQEKRKSWSDLKLAMGTSMLDKTCGDVG